MSNLSANEEFSWSRIIIWLVILALSLFGLCYIYSTGYIGDDYPVRENWQRQLVYLLLGALVFFVLSRWDNRQFSWELFVWVGYFGSLLGLLLVLFIGREVGGARRWLELGPFLLQPAEPAKVFTLLAACWLLNQPAKGHFLPRVLGLAALVLAPAFLIKLEPALGNALIIIPPFLAVLLVKHCPSKLFLGMALLCFLLALAAISRLFWVRSQPPSDKEAAQTSANTSFLRGYHLRRLHSYISGKGSWNERQSIMTVASGGLKGKGYLNGNMKSLGYLPRTVAPTDFIFSVIAEEGGFLYGSLPLLLLYALLLLVCLYWGATASNSLDISICAAFSSLILLHIMVGIGMTIRLLPIIGLPLPLLSYGGSFNISFMAGLGCMAATRIHRNNTQNTSILQIKIARLFNLRMTRTGERGHTA